MMELRSTICSMWRTGGCTRPSANLMEFALSNAVTDSFWQSKLIAERFECLAQIGSGHIGTVYKAKDRLLDKLVAIKVLRENMSPEQLMRFQKEAKLSGRLHHENIAGVFDFGVTEENRPYLVMEFLDGESLDAVIAERGKLTLVEAMPIFLQICAAMEHSHSNGILHRDLKPTNVILMNKNRSDEQGASSDLSAVPMIKIVDFGLARLKDRDERLTP